MGLLPLVIAVVAILAVALALGIVSSLRKGESPKGAAGKRKIRAKDRAQALKEANRRLASNPKDVEALAVVGDVAWEDQDWERALKVYETIAEVGAGNAGVDEFEANSRFGVAALRLGRADEAYRGLVVARTIRQDDFDVNFNLGVLEYQKKAFEKAVGLFKQAVAAQPENAAALR